jgi:NADH dehydrogenase
MAIPDDASILVVGGSGFVGTVLVEQLIERGYRVTVPTRHLLQARDRLLTLPRVRLVEANVYDPDMLTRLVAGHAAVINLVGILHGRAEDFHRAHVTLTERLIAAMQAVGVKRYLHMSALGADVAGASNYQRSKGEAEARVRASGLDWTIYRPSLIFGVGRCFVSMFADLLKLAPCVPLAAATARMQPVWVGDVTRAFLVGLARDDWVGVSLNLVGPQIYTLKELVVRIGELAGTPRCVFGIPEGLARLQALALSVLPNPPLTGDNLDSLKTDNIDPAGFPAQLGWAPTAFETIAPTLLQPGRVRDRYLALRQTSGRMR